jgi:hypothetical protein
MTDLSGGSITQSGAGVIGSPTLTSIQRDGGRLSDREYLCLSLRSGTQRARPSVRRPLVLEVRRAGCQGPGSGSVVLRPSAPGAAAGVVVTLMRVPRESRSIPSKRSRRPAPLRSAWI